MIFRALRSLYWRLKYRRYTPSSIAAKHFHEHAASALWRSRFGAHRP